MEILNLERLELSIIFAGDKRKSGYVMKLTPFVRGS